MALDVLMVDDEMLARSRLRSLLADCRDAQQQPMVRVVAEASNAEQALAQMRERPFDAILLDIHMPGHSGMALARQIQGQARAPALVFVTAHADHALDAFEVNAVDYLTKPVRLERLAAALQKVQAHRQVRRRDLEGLDALFVIVHERGATRRIPLAEVLYFKAELKYVTVRTATHSHILDGSLAELEHRFSDRVLRVHRNALALRHALRALEKTTDAQDGEAWVLRLDGLDEPLAVSRRHVTAVRDCLAQGAA